MQIIRPNHKKYLYLLSFCEGAAVMVCELVGAKMLAPYFGTSLYVWAAALGLTLAGLAGGYFWGGKLAARSSRHPAILLFTYTLVGILLALMPWTGHLMLNLTIQLPLRIGAVLALLVFMVPPLVGMGMISPLVIDLLTSRQDRAGNSAGNVYAISTLGGIGATFLTGFYLIPVFGISRPAAVSGLLLIALAILGFLVFRPTKNAPATKRSEGNC